MAKAHNNAVDKKTIAIFSKNVFYARYASAWLNLHGYNVKMLDMINDDLREQYKALIVLFLDQAPTLKSHRVGHRN